MCVYICVQKHFYKAFYSHEMALHNSFKPVASKRDKSKNNKNKFVIVLTFGGNNLTIISFHLKHSKIREKNIVLVITSNQEVQE